jgi:hypothetical protein
MGERLAIVVERGKKKAFASAVEWPGWSRGDKTPEAAIEALLAYAPRFAPVAKLAGLAFGRTFDADVVEEAGGGSATDWGVPSCLLFAADRRPLDAGEAARLASIVDASWATFDAVAATSPAELRKGPRGGGRDRDKMVDHVDGSDWSYAKDMGIRVPEPASRADVEVMRAQMLEALRQPSNGSPIGGRRWPARYAARRIAWHALDHAWEMEDRST